MGKKMKKGIDYIGVGVGAVIFNSEGKVFLAKRGREARNESGKWEFPGGGVDFGETLEHAICREVREEYGCEIEVLELLDVVNHLIPAEKQHWVSPTFLCRITMGTPCIREPHKCDEIGWFVLDDIFKKDLSLASKKSLQSLQRKLNHGNGGSFRPFSFGSCPPSVPRPLFNMFDANAIDAILLLGPTGVGKSPLGDSIAQHGLFGRRCHHLDFGAELRFAVSVKERSNAYTGDELDFIHGVLERGLLLENEHFPLAEKIISLFLKRSDFLQRDILVLNGIPRHRGQARDIETLARIHALIVLDCSAEVVQNRIYSDIGGDRKERVDDTDALIEKKLIIFRQRTTPLIDHYEKLGSRIYRVSVTSTMTPSESYRALSSLAAAHPPIAFVAEPPQ